MKICFFHINAYSLFNPKIKSPIGGAEVDLYLLANRFVKDKEFSVSFITGDWGQKDDEQIGGVNLLKAYALKKGVLNHLLALRKIWKVLNKADAQVYVQEGAGVETGVISFFCRLKRRKFIFKTAHDRDCDGSYGKSNGLRGRIYNWGLKHADLIITQNETNRKSLEKQGLTSTVLKNPYDISTKPSFKGEEILWIARSVPWKRPEIFLDIPPLFPKKQFRMVLAVHPHHKQYFQKIYNLAKAVRRRSKNLSIDVDLPHNKVDGVFYNTKILINTSKHEGFPITFVEACKNAVAIISLKVNPDNFITQHQLGVVCNDNFKELVRQLKTFLNDKKSLRKLQSNAHLYAKNNHDIEKIFLRMEKLVRSLMK